MRVVLSGSRCVGLEVELSAVRVVAKVGRGAGVARTCMTIHVRCPEPSGSLDRFLVCLARLR